MPIERLNPPLTAVRRSSPDLVYPRTPLSCLSGECRSSGKQKWISPDVTGTQPALIHCGAVVDERVGAEAVAKIHEVVEEHPVRGDRPVPPVAVRVGPVICTTPR